MKKNSLKKNHVGVVLKTSEHKENGSIIKAFCADGFISVIVRGTHKLNSKTRPLSQPLTKINFMSTSTHQLNTLTEGVIIDNYTELKAENAKALMGYIFLEKIDRLVVEHVDFQMTYQFLEQSLELLKKSNFPLVVLSMYEVKFLYLLGIYPSFSNCIACKKTILHGYFSVNLGGILCDQCSLNNSYDLDKNHTKALKILYRVKINDIDEHLLSSIADYADQIQIVIDQYYEYYLGFVTKSKKIYRQLH